MTGTLDQAFVEGHFVGVLLRGGGVTDYAGVARRHQAAGFTRRCHPFFREARTFNGEPGEACGAARRRRDGVDHRQNHEAPLELLGHSDDGCAQVVDLDHHWVSDADGKFTVGTELAVDVSQRAGDHCTDLIAHGYLRDQSEEDVYSG